jgi:hypothetical protein
VGDANVLVVPTDVSNLEQVVKLRDRVYEAWGEVSLNFRSRFFINWVFVQIISSPIYHFESFSMLSSIASSVSCDDTIHLLHSCYIPVDPAVLLLIIDYAPSFAFTIMIHNT